MRASLMHNNNTNSQSNKSNMVVTLGTAALAATASLLAGWILGAHQRRWKAALGHRVPAILQWGQPRRCAFDDATADDLLTIAEHIIQCAVRDKPANACLLATVDAAGAPRVRPINPMVVQLRRPQNNNSNNEPPHVIFFTNRQSRKYQQLQHEDRVELCYLDADNIASVRLAGRVTQQSAEQSVRYWSPRLQYFIQEGPHNDDDNNVTTRFVTFKLVPERTELVSVGLGLATVERSDWHPYTLHWQGHAWVKEAYPIAANAATDQH